MLKVFRSIFMLLMMWRCGVSSIILGKLDLWRLRLLVVPADGEVLRVDVAALVEVVVAGDA